MNIRIKKEKKNVDIINILILIILYFIVFYIIVYFIKIFLKRADLNSIKLLLDRFFSNDFKEDLLNSPYWDENEL